MQQRVPDHRPSGHIGYGTYLTAKRNLGVLTRLTTRPLALVPTPPVILRHPRSYQLPQPALLGFLLRASSMCLEPSLHRCQLHSMHCRRFKHLDHDLIPIEDRIFIPERTLQSAQADHRGFKQRLRFHNDAMFDAFGICVLHSAFFSEHFIHRMVEETGRFILSLPPRPKRLDRIDLLTAAALPFAPVQRTAGQLHLEACRLRHLLGKDVLFPESSGF